ncbi:MAG: hypothetical protein IJ525_01065 [Alphaproteobacteria bacterium]|nr:hypothetical protein [Alphaproteobacteria bacterium]
MADKKEWVEMRLSGVLLWIHRAIMLITLPFRKFWQITVGLLVLILILIAVPMFKGIKLHDVWAWYMVKMPTHEFVEIKEEAIYKVKEKAESIERIVKPAINKKQPQKAEGENKKEDVKFVSWNVAGFRKAKYNPEKAKLKAKSASKRKLQIMAHTPNDGKNNSEKYYDGDLSQYYIVLDNNDLEYLETPEKLYSTVDVVGPNSFYIAGEYVYLYGIYSNPNDYDLKLAQDFLVTATKDRQVYCEVVAYTSQSQAGTALCFVDGIFLNKKMVDYHLADNVGLK